MMVRTQLQLDDDVYDAVRKRAFSERRSMSAVVRDILRDALSKEPRSAGEGVAGFTFIGSGYSGRSDISVNHDEALAEDFA